MKGRWNGDIGGIWGRYRGDVGEIAHVGDLLPPISPLYLPYISLYLPYISPISPYRILRAVPLLSHLTEAERDGVISQLKETKYAPTEFIIRQVREI